MPARIIRALRLENLLAEGLRLAPGAAVFDGTGVVSDELVLTAGLCPHMARTLQAKDRKEPLALAFAAAMKERQQDSAASESRSHQPDFYLRK